MRGIYEYVWLDADGGFRSKIRVIEDDDENHHINNIEKYYWNYDGSSTGQATTEDSEVILRPVRFYPNPLLEELSHSRFYLCLCESVDREGRSVVGSHYQFAKAIFDNPVVKEERPWLGLEQEYFFINPVTKLPVGLESFFVEPQGKYYCGIGSRMTGRRIAEEHMRICLEAGIHISGINAEVARAQWEFQVGPVEGIEAAHSLLVARYLLLKIAEREGLDISFHPKPVKGDWNGSGCHTNFSTAKMREEGGYQEILQAMDRLKENHQTHMELYGKDNHLRLTGHHETAPLDQFSWGVGSRNTSVRIGYQTAREGKGYFEDRRPAANMDPYLVCASLCKTILLSSSE